MIWTQYLLDKYAKSYSRLIDYIKNYAGIGGSYTHPATHPAEMIVQDTDRNFVTAAEKGNIHAAGSDNQDLSGKQDLLVSGGNIKTINGTSVLGTGDIEVGGSVSAHEATYNHTNYNTAYSHSQSAHLQFSGLAKITVSGTQPTNPTTGDLWVNTNI